MPRRIPVAGPWITEKEVQYVADAAQNGWYDRASEFPSRFEETLTAAVGVSHGIAVPHATSALHLALAALGLGPGDEVIVPEITWIASAAPVHYVGAVPVFVDINPIHWCLDIEAVKRAYTPRTRAVIAVDLYGAMPDYPALEAWANEKGIAIIEDAAQGLGASLHGRMAGSFGRCAVFSFHGSKTLSTGEGGMLVTSDTALYERALFLRDHGRKPGDTQFLNTEVAFKYRMSAVQAALGLAQAERLNDLVERKRMIFSWYEERLKGLEGVHLNAPVDGLKNAYWMVTAVWDPSWGIEKHTMMQWLKEEGVDSRPFFSPLSSLTAYADHAQALAPHPVAYGISPYGINLPSALCLEEEDVDTVCRTFTKGAHPLPRKRSRVQSLDPRF